MITKMFSLYDGKAQMFQTPFYMPTLGMALRAFADLCNDPNTMVYRHPEDFSLYEIGEYDDSNAVHNSLSPLKLVGTAQEFQKRSPEKTKPETIDMAKLMSVSAKNNIVEKAEVI